MNNSVRSFYSLDLFSNIRIILFLLFICNYSIYSQNCFNSDFETGDVDGYTTYTGMIASDGTITIDNQQFSPDQHNVFFVLDGYDDIAMARCTENKYLPVVPPAGGAYALRLGNSNNGARAEKVTLSFNVTSENSFFLLRYAVLLNDPGHEPYEQPRFRLSIVDDNGDEFPCGRYEVFAAPELENFENCSGNWKVRPWTNIGIELLSYLGQNINIELSTNDCSRGGHAGYAYLDATCKPLEIELFNNCTDTSYATMQVTPGFDKYLWSTGDSTSMIGVQNPVVGDVYYVTVTSATGCDLVLNDTIPPFDIGEATPIFDPSTTTHFCADTALWFTPTGTNLTNVYSVELGGFIDSLVVSNAVQSEYTFIAYTSYGCPKDTVSHYFLGKPKVQDSINHNLCNGTNEGSVFIDAITDGMYSYEWSTGATDQSIENLLAGCYKLTITDSVNDCAIMEEYEVTEPDTFRVNVNQDDFVCLDSVASATLWTSGGNAPYEYSYDQGQSFSSNRFYDFYTEGDNFVYIMDSNGCLDSVVVNFPSMSLPSILALDVDVDSCGHESSFVEVIEVVDGVSPYRFALDNLFAFNSDSLYLNVSNGDHILYVRDENGCIGSIDFYIPDIPYFEISEVLVDDTKCDMQNGAVEIITSVVDSVSFALDDLPFILNNTFFELDSGVHTAYAKNKYGCIDTLEFFIAGSVLPNPDVVIIDNLCYDEFNGSINLMSIYLDNPYLYEWSNGAEGATLESLAAGIYLVTVVDQDSCVNYFDYEILQPDEITLEVEGVFITCPEMSDGEIIVRARGGVGVFNYSIDNGANYTTDSIFSNLMIADYLIQIQDENNCIKDTFISIVPFYSYDSLVFEIVQDTCASGSASLEILDVINGTAPYTYSLNGIDYQSPPFFSDLMYGDYTLSIQDANSCVWVENFEIDTIHTVHIIELEIEHTSCEENNGSVRSFTSSDHDNTYDLNTTAQSSSYFENLSPGIYTLRVENISGCFDEIDFEIRDSNLPIIEDVLVSYTSCSNFSNRVEIVASSGIPPYQFKIDDIDIAENGIVMGIAPGEHMVELMDADSCMVLESFFIEEVRNLESEIVGFQNPDCGKSNGYVEIVATGGAGTTVVNHMDQIFPTPHVFQNLDIGIYDYQIVDTTDCSVQLRQELTTICSCYMPNIFSPNNDGINETFTVYIPEGATAVVNHFRIYDRWGEEVFLVENIEIPSDPIEWNGRMNGKHVVPGVYAYTIQLEFYNGQLEEHHGTVQVIR